MRDTQDIFDEMPDSVESMIRAAGDFIQPSDDLRPRALESAREYRNDQRARRKLFGFAVLGSVVLALVTCWAKDADRMQLQATAPSSAEMYQQASALGSLPHIGGEWGLTEAFTRLRQNQASWLGQNSSPKQ